jgi:hypothetical protein
VPSGILSLRTRWCDGVATTRCARRRGLLSRPAFWTADAELGTTLAGAASTFAIRNLTNTSYREPLSFIDEPGRTYSFASSAISAAVSLEGAREVSSTAHRPCSLVLLLSRVRGARAHGAQRAGARPLDVLGRGGAVRRAGDASTLSQPVGTLAVVPVPLPTAPSRWTRPGTTSRTWARSARASSWRRTAPCTSPTRRTSASWPVAVRRTRGAGSLSVSRHGVLVSLGCGVGAPGKVRDRRSTARSAAGREPGWLRHDRAVAVGHGGDLRAHERGRLRAARRPVLGERAVLEHLERLSDADPAAAGRSRLPRVPAGDREPERLVHA